MSERVTQNNGLTPRITVVIPCLNEEQGLPRVLKAIPPEVFEIVVLDNCSTDRTVEVASNGDPRVRVVRHRENLGYGGSYIRGLPMVRGDVIVTSDGDGTYPVHDCLRLVAALVDGGYDFLSCSRFPLHDRSNMSVRNRFGNWMLNSLVNGFYGLRLKDAQSGMWVFRTAVLDKMALTATGMAFSHEIKIEAFTNPTIKAGEVPIPYAERIGTSKLYPFRDGVRMVRFVMSRRFSPPARPQAPVAAELEEVVRLESDALGPEPRVEEPVEVRGFRR
jgi:glycosyltransferase involved in cell wall biosynthesis